MNPLVTIICVCHNHERFVLEALESVAKQTYKQTQLIVVDDASSDGSKRIIAEFVRTHPGVQFISHDVNLGICKAFNSAMAHARGDYVIDFSADDVFLPDRLETGVSEFGKFDLSYGVQFGDAIMIDELGQLQSHHSDRFPIATLPQGDVYEQVIRIYFVNGPSTMVRKHVLDEMGGYDESLAYEDFDFWIRSSRHYKYFYIPKALVKHRVVRGGLHEKQFKTGSAHAWSTLAVCRKILALNRTRSEQAALTSRILYELKHSMLKANFGLAWQYIRLWRENLSWKPA